MKFVGRAAELQEITRLYTLKISNLVVIYGRRRVGKSTLVDSFISKKIHLNFEGLEGLSTKSQIKQFTKDLQTQIDEPLLKKATFNHWDEIFDYLTSFLAKQQHKTIVFFDELQWLAAGRSKLVSLIKLYWDRHWQKMNVMLILCGSVSSFMIKKVVSSRALYGRIDWELCLQPLSPQEAKQLIGKQRSNDEVLLYNIVFGGIPKYLHLIDPNKSFQQNMDQLFFRKNALLVNEYERIFYSQFKEHKNYEAIANMLKDGPQTMQQISEKVKLSSGGSLTSYLQGLEKAAFIRKTIPYNKNLNSRLIKYQLSDEYLRFYYKYVQPNLKVIQSNLTKNLFSILVEPYWKPWLGYAFENFCHKNAMYLAELMGFSDQLVNWGPLFQKGSGGFQVDLIYLRTDNVITLCEIKYINKLVSTKIVAEVEQKCSLLQIPRGYTLEKALISRFGADEALTNLNYFHHYLSGDDFF